jgi:hypothetical protein
MTAFMVVEAYVTTVEAEQKAMSTVAYRTALFTRMKHTSLPKNEAALLKKPEPKKKAQSLQDQFAMAKVMTQMMSKEVH